MMSSGTVARSAEVRLARAGERCLGNLLEQDVGLAVEDAMALLDRGAADGLREMALAGAGQPEKEGVFAPLDEAAGGEFEDEGAVHLLVEVEVEGVEGLAGVAEAGLLVPALKEPVLAAHQLVVDEGRDEVERGELFGLGLTEPGFEDGGHAGERSLRRARSSSMRVMRGLLSCGRSRSR